MIRVLGSTVTDSTAGRPWVFGVRVVPPNCPRPRRWRARLRALGQPFSYCRLVSQLARRDLIINGRRHRAIEEAIARRAADIR